MKLALLGSINSIHTIRWANALVKRGHEIHLITQHYSDNLDAVDSQVILHCLKIRAEYGYFLNMLQLRNILKTIKPDLLHGHYASGYGTLGRLSGFHPFVLSVWGSDIYDFPGITPFHNLLIKSNLASAEWVCSTSQVMANQTLKIYPKTKGISITPFGIDLNKFFPDKTLKSSHTITIGTVKNLEYKYGIDTLIKSFAKAIEILKASPTQHQEKLRLVIIGDGFETKRLERLVNQLNLQKYVSFLGKISHKKVPGHLNKFDIYVALSRLSSESFGVAILEASACALPVIVSDVGGLPEVVENNITGFVVRKEEPTDAALKIVDLVQNSKLREKMGAAGRQRVINNYDWETSVSIMENVYDSVLKDSCVKD